MIKYFLINSALLAVGLTAVSVSSTKAATLDTSGVWSSVNGGSNLTGIGTNQIGWGHPPGGLRSSYVFTGVNDKTIVLPPLGDSSPIFELGDFTHHNFSIPSGITRATLNVNFELTHGTSISQIFSFDFLHTETFNNQPGSICSNPPGFPAPCPDIVSFLDNGESSQTIVINGQEFALLIEGFKTASEESLVSEFITLEDQSNTATLFARLARPNSDVEKIPEPGTILGLIVAGGLGLLTRRNLIL